MKPSNAAVADNPLEPTWSCWSWLQDTLVKIAKKLKKNNVAVDLVSFGHEADNEEKLTAFHSAVNSNDNSHLVTVPPGPVLSDVLIGSPIFQVGVASSPFTRDTRAQNSSRPASAECAQQLLSAPQGLCCVPQYRAVP